MLTIEDAKKLEYRTEVYHQYMRDSKGAPLRARVNGQCQLWKTRPTEFKIPVKHGLYDSGYITDKNAGDWCLNIEDALLYPLRRPDDWNRFRKLTGERPTKFICSCCKLIKSVPRETVGTGYSIKNDELICYMCDANQELAYMKEHGMATLYLSKNIALDVSSESAIGKAQTKHFKPDTYKVSNWPGSLTIPVQQHKEGEHNLAKRRIDVWFNGPDNYIWHGFSLGDNDLCYCKRTKKKVVIKDGAIQI